MDKLGSNHLLGHDYERSIQPGLSLLKWIWLALLGSGEGGYMKYRYRYSTVAVHIAI